jgi:hypothetical protein
MTDLSPAAQQVFWEFNRVASGKPDGWHYLPAIAAALRAAADQCKIEWNYHPDYPETESVIVVSDLLSIAAELNGIKPTREGD